MRSLLSSSSAQLAHDDLAALYEFPTLTGRQWTRAIFVSTADGAAQGADHSSGSLSSSGDREIFSLQRSLCDLILVGSGTARVEGYRPVKPSEVDAPRRASLGLAPLPPIAVVSRSLSLDPLLLAPGPAPTIVVTTEDAPDTAVSGLGKHIRVVRAGVGIVDLGAAMDQLMALGYQRVLCEGGPTLLAQLADAARLDDLCLTIAPLLVGGDRRRILSGPDLDPLRRMSLAHLLFDDDNLFARYLVDRPADASG